MLGDKGFDKWAGNYDASIPSLSNGYPFEGYYDVLAAVTHQVKTGKETKILDLGIGTGLLSVELYSRGVQVWGVDFSEKMLTLLYQLIQKLLLERMKQQL